MMIFERNWKKRERQLLLSYPEFISKLTLLMGAGLPVRAAFVRMALRLPEEKIGWQKLCV